MVRKQAPNETEQKTFKQPTPSTKKKKSAGDETFQVNRKEVVPQGPNVPVT
jgi:hypothetical protein